MHSSGINTPISRSRHFEIESEAPVGRNPEVLPIITGAAMSYCCVPGCTSYQRKECDKELSFHRFPIIIYIYIFFFNKTARGIRHPSSAHFSTSAILNLSSSSRLVVQVIVVYLYFRVYSHRASQPSLSISKWRLREIGVFRRVISIFL